MAYFKGLGLGMPRRMLLLVTFVFTSLLVQHANAQGSTKDLSSPCTKATPATHAAECDTAITKLECPSSTCACPKDHKWDPTKYCVQDPTKTVITTTTARSGSGHGSAESSAVRTFISPIFVLVGLFLGVGVLSTF